MQLSRLRHGLLLVVPLSCLAGCVMSPLNGEVAVDSTLEEVELSGYTLGPDRFMRLAAAVSPTGPFGSWPGAHATSSSVGTVLDYSGGSVLLYPWSMSHEVPPGLWGSEPGPGACTTPVTYLRVQDQETEFNLYTFDVAGLFEPSHYACISSKLAAGQSVYEAVPACASDDSPVIRIEAQPVCP